MGAVTKTHDLLELNSPDSVLGLDGAPTWVHESLAECPYVVVRRQPPSEGGIAIGVRGKARNQRWAGMVSPDQVMRKVSPYDLRTDATIKTERLSAIPALQHLVAIENRWRDLHLKWGPGGSVGFELASSYLTATASSDLDIVLFAPTRFDYDYARSLLLTVQQIAPSIDVLVETPQCGFSLTEYADSQGLPILLRCPDKPRMASDPWGNESARHLRDDSQNHLEKPS